jgi:hypothetical protein
MQVLPAESEGTGSSFRRWGASNLGDERAENEWSKVECLSVALGFALGTYVPYAVHVGI